MVIGQEIEFEPALFFGFRFDPDDLPEEFLPVDRWKEYLFDHAVPGMIVDESDYLRLLTATLGRVYYTKRMAIPARIEEALPPKDEWRSHAAYSFNPDNFHSRESPCYNCVTWATEIGNRVCSGFLTPVRQGRIKLMADQLKRTQSPGASYGGEADTDSVG